jgi:hypothetical protein
MSRTRFLISSFPVYFYTTVFENQKSEIRNLLKTGYNQNFATTSIQILRPEMCTAPKNRGGGGAEDGGSFKILAEAVTARELFWRAERPPMLS